MKNIPIDIGNYIAGFTDGEGSFNVSIKKRLDYKESWKLTASFNISQKDRVILAWIKLILGCGTLRERNDGVVYYEVTNTSDIPVTVSVCGSIRNFVGRDGSKFYRDWNGYVPTGAKKNQNIFRR
jgi:intein-encoded DNA endonuclease-like protein